MTVARRSALALGRRGSPRFWSGAARVFLAFGLWAGSVSWANVIPVPLGPGRWSAHFHVHDARLFSRPPLTRLDASRDTVVLDPDILLSSVERIRRALVRELGLGGQPSSRVQLLLYHAPSVHQDIRVVSTFLGSRWDYLIEMPDHVDRLKLMRAVVRVVLTEYANRFGGAKSAELPLWLTEGLCLYLLHSVGPELVPQRGEKWSAASTSGDINFVFRHIRAGDALKPAREILRSAQPLTFAALSHPSAELLEGNSLKVFQSSAQLLVTELLRLPEAHSLLKNMLQALPHHWNWETAFLRAFHPVFPTMLEVEKWWALTLIISGGQDPSPPGSPGLTLQRLSQILSTQARISVHPNRTPRVVEIPLPQMLAEWAYHLHRPVLQEKLVHLAFLEVNAPEEIRRLCADYQVLLQIYLQKRDSAAMAPGTRPARVLPPGPVLRQTLRRLDELDERRLALVRNATGVQASTSASTRSEGSPAPRQALP